MPVDFIKKGLKFNALIAFINDTLQNGFERLLSVPFHNPLVVYDNGIGVVLYRAAPFQIELFTGVANWDIPSHTHPNVDSYEMYLGGAVYFTVNDKPVCDPSLVCADEDGLPMQRFNFISVPHGLVHGGRTGPQGAVFLSFQQWLNNVEPTSVVYDWAGGSMGPIHDAVLSPQPDST